MTDRRLAMHAADDEPPLVEDVWEDVLVEFGIERDRAERITRVVFSNPKLTMTERPPDELTRILGDELASLDLDSAVGARSRTLRTLLVDVLQSGLDGILLGPAVAPSDVAHDAAPRGEAFDAIRRSFREANVSPESIEFAEFPSADEGSRSEPEAVTPPTPSAPSGAGEGSETAPDGFSKNRAFPQNIRDAGRPDELADRTETRELLSFIDEARTDGSPTVRKQVMESLAELAAVPGIRGDRQIDKLVRAYREESDPEVRAAIVAGVASYLRATAGPEAPPDGSGEETPPDDDGTAEPDVDPRDASTAKFSDEDG